jgi:hypothetical protein
MEIIERIKPHLNNDDIELLSTCKYLNYNPNNPKSDNSCLLTYDTELFVFYEKKNIFFYGGIIKDIQLPIIHSFNKYSGQNFSFDVSKYIIFFKRIVAYNSVNTKKKNQLEDLLKSMDNNLVKITRRK